VAASRSAKESQRDPPARKSAKQVFDRPGRHLGPTWGWKGGYFDFPKTDAQDLLRTNSATCWASAEVAPPKLAAMVQHTGLPLGPNGHRWPRPRAHYLCRSQEGGRLNQNPTSAYEQSPSPMPAFIPERQRTNLGQ